MKNQNEYYSWLHYAHSTMIESQIKAIQAQNNQDTIPLGGEKVFLEFDFPALKKQEIILQDSLDLIDQLSFSSLESYLDRWVQTIFQAVENLPTEKIKAFYERLGAKI